MKKAIILHKPRTGQAWVAEYQDNPKIVELFGGSLIPTAYLTTVPSWVVQAKIQESNPDYTVTVK